jgi:hypothetical protein
MYKDAKIPENGFGNLLVRLVRVRSLGFSSSRKFKALNILLFNLHITIHKVL